MNVGGGTRATRRVGRVRQHGVYFANRIGCVRANLSQTGIPLRAAREIPAVAKRLTLAGRPGSLRPQCLDGRELRRPRRGTETEEHSNRDRERERSGRRQPGDNRRPVAQGRDSPRSAG